MHWQVGIDEAGYGPTLGPFVMALTASGFSRRLSGNSCLWETLSPWIRASGTKRTGKDNRLVVGDSKKIKVLSGGVGLLGAPWRFLFHPGLPGELSIDEFTLRVGCMGREELLQEFWWTGETTVEIPSAGLHDDPACVERPRFIAIILVMGVSQFNRTCRASGSKGAVTAESWKKLVRSFLALVEPGDTVEILTDKHGGRNHYGELIGSTLGDEAWIVPEVEGAQESNYRTWGLPIDSCFRFIPRAEAACPMVALASMIAKHMREETMGVFNNWWRRHVPELEPTSGYPGDAPRFIELIRPAAIRCGIAMDSIVRDR